MPVDTRDKRSSAVGMAAPWRARLPHPDGAVSQGDRQHVAYAYSGILATPLVVVLPPLSAAFTLTPALRATVTLAPSAAGTLTLLP